MLFLGLMKPTDDWEREKVYEKNGSKSLMNLFMDQQFVNAGNKIRRGRKRRPYTFPSV